MKFIWNSCVTIILSAHVLFILFDFVHNLISFKLILSPFYYFDYYEHQYFTSVLFHMFSFIKNALFGSYSWMSHRTFIESSAVTTAFWLDQYGGLFASIFSALPAIHVLRSVLPMPWHSTIQQLNWNQLSVSLSVIRCMASWNWYVFAHHLWKLREMVSIQSSN